MCLCLIGVCVEGAAMSGKSVCNDKSQSITAAPASDTGQHTHPPLLLWTQVNTLTHSWNSETENLLIVYYTASLIIYLLFSFQKNLNFSFECSKCHHIIQQTNWINHWIMLNLDLLVLYSVRNGLLLIRVICYLTVCFEGDSLHKKMLPGVSGKAAVLCVTSALTSTAAMGMMISTYVPWTLNLCCFVL